MAAPSLPSSLDTRCARCGACESTRPLHRVGVDLVCAGCFAAGSPTDETIHVHFEDDVEIDPKARAILDAIKFVSYLVVVFVAVWSDLIRAMAQGVFVADALIWFIAMLHQFSQRVYLGFAEAAGYLLVFILFATVGGGPSLPKDPGLLGLTILMFITTFVIKGVWTAYRRIDH